MVIAQENMKLAAFIFPLRWGYTFDWVIMLVDEETVHFLAGKKKLEDEYKDPHMLPQINKSDIAGTVH